MRHKLGPEQFTRIRNMLLEHQEAFMSQIYELHRIVGLQKHLTAMCERPDLLASEVFRLQMEERHRYESVA